MPNYVHIMVDLTPLTAYWRGVISGVARFCQERDWLRIRLPTSEWELIGDGESIDGVIAVVAKPDPHDPATRFGKPVINVSTISQRVPFPTITVDNISLGRMAGDHLLAQGYQHFAYHMESRVYFSVQRLAGFRQRLAEAGKDVAVFDTAPVDGQTRNATELRQATTQWLRDLPKPLGLFTHNDGRAVMLLDICRDAGIRVPQQVGVIGGDDDTVIATASSPSLSSINVASDVIGYRAAAMLMDLLAGKPAPEEVILVPPRHVVERQSTRPVFFDDELLSQAVAYIREHAPDPIDVGQVLEEVPLSRRSLERKFRERLGRSPGDEIRRVQIEKAQRLLIETDQTLRAIGLAAGYSQFRNFATAFQRVTGMTPRMYRQAFRMR
jgi:LacI family transcriptional regulator